MARDKWLSADGLIFPDRCTLFVSAIEDETYSNNTFWQNVYGFDMSSIHNAVNSVPAQTHVRRRKLISDACPFKFIDFYRITIAEWKQFAIVFRLNVKRGSQHFVALITFFELEFTKCHTPMKLSSRPGSKLTTWTPTVFYLKPDIMLRVHKDDEVFGSLVFNGAANIRNAKIRVDLCYRNRYGFLREHFIFQFQ